MNEAVDTESHLMEIIAQLEAGDRATIVAKPSKDIFVYRHPSGKTLLRCIGIRHDDFQTYKHAQIRRVSQTSLDSQVPEVEFFVDPQDQEIAKEPKILGPIIGYVALMTDIESIELEPDERAEA